MKSALRKDWQLDQCRNAPTSSSSWRTRSAPTSSCTRKYGFVQTPNLDRLRGQGTAFRQAIGAANHGYNVSDADATGVFPGPTEGFCDFVACRQFAEYLRAADCETPFLAFIRIYSPHPPLCTLAGVPHPPAPQ